MGTPRLVVLLPVRNAADQLTGWLDSARRVCDAVVALDDGSMDDTRAVLDADPLVHVVLSNPRRESFVGWDDGENRNRLLEAAGDLDPDWVFFLDTDEQLDAPEAAALRAFVATDAIPGCAYGFRMFRMLPDGSYDPNFEWVHRLFAYQPNQGLSGRRFDRNPVPTSIPEPAWVRTTFRIQHWGEPSEEARAARLAKYREADPDGEYRFYYESWTPLSPPPYPRWRPRQPDTPALFAPPVPADLRREPEWPAIRPAPRRGHRARVTCLLPARNCVEDLPGYFESVTRFADAVVALDDGSTDETGEVLEAQPLVTVLLRNEARPTYAGWDDAANRNRLLGAAAELEPDWIVSLDADERIPADDAAALRRFIDEEALPGFAYGFNCYRMIDDLQHYDRIDQRVWRLFSHDPGQRFPDRGLHFFPIPTDIAKVRWLPTTVRIQHLAGMTEERRQARWEKYQQADPHRAWEPNYEYTRATPGERRAWAARPADLPVLAGSLDAERRVELEVAGLDLEGPVVSVVVLADVTSDPSAVDETVSSLRRQEVRDPFEILVAGPSDSSRETLRAATDEVVTVPVDAAHTSAAIRNAALRVARGDYVLFVEPGAVLPSGSLAAILDAHERGFTLVGAEARNQTDTVVGWTHYFLDHAASLPHGLIGHVDLAPSTGSWAKEPLLRVGGFREVQDSEAAVTAEALHTLGHFSWRGTFALGTRCGARGWGSLLAARVRYGRTLAALIQDGAAAAVEPPPPGRAWALRYGPRRVAAIRRHVAHADPEMAAQFRRVAPMVTLGVLATWAGVISETLIRDASRTGGR
jgi:glycosyltransferase involved in cell wall biosynthesis